MILDSIKLLNERHIVLASASPRRSQLLAQLGLTNIDIVPSSFEENLDKKAFAGPQGYAKETARCKALDVRKALREKSIVPDLIISADTVVEIDGQVLEKPADAAHAFKMLRSLSGRKHAVHTGFTLIAPHTAGNSARGLSKTSDGPILMADALEGNDKIISSATSTAVTFGELRDSEIEAYIDTGECYGKAGAYGIQGPVGAWAKEIQGCYFNILGLPLYDVAVAMKSLLLGQ